MSRQVLRIPWESPAHELLFTSVSVYPCGVAWGTGLWLPLSWAKNKRSPATKVTNSQARRAKRQHLLCLKYLLHSLWSKKRVGHSRQCFLTLGAAESPGGFVTTDYRAPPPEFLTQWV